MNRKLTRLTERAMRSLRKSAASHFQKAMEAAKEPKPRKKRKVAANHNQV